LALVAVRDGDQGRSCAALPGHFLDGVTMTTHTIRGSQIHSEKEFHKLLSTMLDFGPYYGNNLDALWDRLSTDIERPVRLIWTEAAQSRINLGSDVFDRIVDVIRGVEAHDDRMGVRRAVYDRDP
jgi:ribonuclease inhibitor